MDGDCWATAKHRSRGSKRSSRRASQRNAAKLLVMERKYEERDRNVLAILRPRIIQALANRPGQTQQSPGSATVNVDSYSSHLSAPEYSEGHWGLDERQDSRSFQAPRRAEIVDNHHAPGRSGYRLAKLDCGQTTHYRNLGRRFSDHNSQSRSFLCAHAGESDRSSRRCATGDGLDSRR